MSMARGALLSSREAVRKAFSDMAPAAHLRNSQNQAELFLVGVSHVSPASASMVQKLIRDVQPDVVAVELCEARSKSWILTNSKSEKYKFWEIFGIPGGLRQKLITFTVTNMYATLQSKGIKPGEELRHAVEEGRAVGAKVAFVDRDVNVTLQRAGQHLSLKDILAFLRQQKQIEIEHHKLLTALRHAYHGNFDGPFVLQDVVADALELAEKYFPQLLKTLVDERNEYMVNELRKIEGSIVGVVGALHVSGMQRVWQEAEISCSKSI